jgi:predicted deacylase
MCEIPFTVLVGGIRKPRLLVLAGVHGDEYEGVAALHELLEEIDPSGLRGMLTILPVANPQAFYAGTRLNPVDLGDLNRGFPGNPGGTQTDRLAHALFHGIVLEHDCLLSMHCWSKEATVIPYVEYPCGPTSVSRRSHAAARALGLEFMHPYEWPKGVLSEAAIKYGILSIEPEVGGMGMLTSEGKRVYKSMVYRLLLHFKMYKPAEACMEPLYPNPKMASHVDMFANHAGLFRGQVRAGDTVVAGQVLGVTSDLSGERLEEVRAPEAGTVAILRTFASVQPGNRLVQIFLTSKAVRRPKLA